MYNQPSQPKLVTEQKVNVTVGSTTFAIPAHKVSELMNVLRSWQSISLPESKTQGSPYGGPTLIHG